MAENKRKRIEPDISDLAEDSQSAELYARHHNKKPNKNAAALSKSHEEIRVVTAQIEPEMWEAVGDVKEELNVPVAEQNFQPAYNRRFVELARSLDNVRAPVFESVHPEQYLEELNRLDAERVRNNNQN